MKYNYSEGQTFNLKAEIKELKGDLAVCKANVESLENVKGYLQAEKKRLKSIIKDNGAELNEKDAEIEELKDRLERQKRELIDEIRHGAGI